MRKSGILMHITSLPSPYGIGSMGASAYEFVDFLEQAGQSYWQILPLNPTGYGDSPYQSASTFAGNHYLIDLDLLVKDGLLTEEDLAEVDWSQLTDRVDFGFQYHHRMALLRKAYTRFVPDADYGEYLKKNADWLEDYALFMAIKEKFHGAPWQNWTLILMMRLPEVLDNYRQELAERIEFQYFLQYQFHTQWTALRSYANGKGIRIIGDVPIYVPLDSADAWANPFIFQLDASRRPKLVAGCPPDSFSEEGQLWGNPLYDWDVMKESGYGWWIRRLKAAAQMYDVIRLDHFRGFESYWAVPAGDKNAIRGVWKPGPGMDFIHAIQTALPNLEFIAEDLGFVTGGVRDLVEGSGYPGMKVLQFAFDSREESDYLPHLYPVNSVVYLGTHDNLTAQQWLDEAAPADVAEAKAYLGLNEEEGAVWGMIRGCMSSVSKLCVIQMQDYLGIAKEGRMNFPGTLSTDNWTWRAQPGFDSPELAKKIHAMTQRYGRL